MGQKTIVAELQELDAVSRVNELCGGVRYHVSGHDRTASKVLYKHGYSVADVHGGANGETYIYALPPEQSELRLSD